MQNMRNYLSETADQPLQVLFLLYNKVQLKRSNGREKLNSISQGGGRRLQDGFFFMNPFAARL
jgi:hypothetical protein